MTLEEYLAYEEQSDIRHEYVAGEVHAMVGASRRHGQIVMNIAGQLWTNLRGSSCETHTNDVKVRVAQDIIYYPDVVVTCSAAESDPLIIQHPTLVVEVLSPSTASIDRREKMVSYRKIPSLLCYLVVYQDERRIEKHYRNDTSEPWEFDLLLDVYNSVLNIPGLDVQMTMDQVYEGVTFDAEA